MAINIDERSLERKRQASVFAAQRTAEIKNQQLQKQQEMQNQQSQNKSVFEKIGDTLGDIFVSGLIGEGIIKGVENVVDFGSSVVGGIAGLVGDKETQKRMEENIKYDWTGQNVLNPLAEQFDASVVNDSKLLTLGKNVASGVGQMLPNVAISAIPVAGQALSMGLLFGRAAGGSIEESLNEGASFNQALLYGAASGALEVLSEGISDKLFGPTVIDKAAGVKGIFGRSIFKTARSGLGRVAQEALGEGLEEGFSEFFNPLLKRIYTTENTGFLTQEHLQNIMDSAVVGALTSAVFKGTVGQLPAYKNSSKLAQMQDQIIEYNDKASRLYKDATEGKLTSEEINQQSSQLLSERNTLESELNSIYQTISSDKFKNRAQELVNRSGTLNGLNFENLNNNKQILNNNQIAQNGTLATAQNTYNKEAYSPNLINKESNLAYKPTEQALSEDAKVAKQGIANLSKALGIDIDYVFVDGNVLTTPTGDMAKGGHDSKDIIYINKDLSSKDMLKQVIMHEFTHTLEGTQSYENYSKFVLSELNKNKLLAKQLGIKGSVEEELKTILARYVNQGAIKNSLSTQQQLELAKAELIAKYTSEKLFTDESAIKRICQTNLSFAQKILNWIKDTIAKLTGTSKEERQLKAFLKKAENLYTQAIKEAGVDIRNERYFENSEVDNNKNIKYDLNDNYKKIEGVSEDEIPSKLQDALIKYFEERNSDEGKQRRFEKHATIGISNNRNQRWGYADNSKRVIRQIASEFGLNEDKEAIKIFLETVEKNKYFQLVNIGNNNIAKIIDRDVLPKQLRLMKDEAAKMGIRLLFSSGPIEDGNVYASTYGLYFSNGSDNRIIVGLSENRDFVSIARHERLHYIHKVHKQLYEEFDRNIKSILTENEKTALYDKFYEKYSKTYNKLPIELFQNYVWEEALANIYQLREKVKNQSEAYDAIEKLETAIKNQYKLDKDIQYSVGDSKSDNLSKIENKYKNYTKYFDVRENSGEIKIGNLVINENSRNKGIGQKILTDIINYADDVNKTITLTPTKEFGTYERLKNWYKKNGFVENKGKNTDLQISDTMYRLPNNIQYSLVDDGEGNELVALHNLSESKLRGAIKLGGLPVPSIAITKAEQGHSNFGDITLVFKKDTINPANLRNKVYSADAYSKRFPKTVNKFNKAVVKDLQDRFRESAKLLGEDVHNLETYLESDNMDNIASTLARKNYVKLQFLKDNGENFEPVYKEYKLKDDEEFIVKRLIEKFPEEVKYKGLRDSRYLIDEIIPFVKQAEYDFWIDYADKVEKSDNPMGASIAKGYRALASEINVSLWKAEELLNKAEEYQNKNGSKVLDESATTGKLNSAVEGKTKEIETYIYDILTEYNEGLFYRNDKDIFDYYGNRRSFNQIYDKANLENIVKYMSGTIKNTEGWNYGVGNVRSLLTKQFKTLDEIRKDKDKIISSEQMESLKEQSQDLFCNLCAKISDDIDTGSYILAEIAEKPITTENIESVFKDYQKKPTNELISEIKSFMNQLKDYPTEYFEAKPQRAVKFDEIAKVIAPETVSEDIKYFFKHKGIEVELYKSGEENRKTIIKNLPNDLKFSISDTDSQGNKLTDAQREYFKNSKVVDNKGNLKVMYHTTTTPDFTIFDANKSDDKLSLFFTDNIDVANTYSLGTGKFVDVNNLNKTDIKKMTLEEFNKYVKGFKTTLVDAVEKIDNDYIERKEKAVKERLKGELLPSAYNNPETLNEFVKARLQDIYDNKGKYIANGVYGASFGTLEEMKQKAFENLKMTEAYKKTIDDTYQVYLNVKNPLIIEGEKTVRNVYDTIYLTYDYGDFYFHAVTDEDYEGIKFSHRLESIKDKKNLKEIKDFLNTLDNEEVKSAVLEFLKTDNTGNYYKSHIKYQGKSKALNTKVYQKWNHIEYKGSTHNTRGWAHIAYADGHDGVLFNNIIDDGGRKYGQKLPSQVVAVFDSNQIKSIDNKKPTQDDDIRYSVDDKSTQEIKYRANVKQDKVYNKNEIEKIIKDTISSLPDVKITAKVRDAAIEHLLEKMNSQDINSREESAKQIADFILNNALYDLNQEQYEDYQMAVEKKDALSKHMKDIRFGRDIYEQLVYSYGEKQARGIILSLGDGKVHSIGTNIIDIANEISNETGLDFDTSRADQDVFIDIYEQYQDAKDTISNYKDMQKKLAKDVLSEQEIETDRDSLIKSIITSYDENGHKTSLAKLKEGYAENLKKVRKDLRAFKNRTIAEIDFLRINRDAREFLRRGYSASELKNDIVEGLLKEVVGAANIRGVNKTARERMRALKEIYTNVADKSILKEQLNSEQESFEIFGQKDSIFDENLANMIDYIANGKGELTAEELRLYTKITQGIIYLYKNYDKVFKDGVWKSTTELATKYWETARENFNIRNKSLVMKTEWKTRNILDPHTVMRNLDGYNFAYNKELGIIEDKGFFNEIYKTITDGEVKARVAELDLLMPFGEFYQNHKGFQKDLTSKKLVVNDALQVFEDGSAEKIKLEVSLGEAVGIYLTSLRPQSNFYNTNIVLQDSETYEKSEFKLNKSDVEALYNQFNEEEKEYIRLVQEFFNKKATALKVETDMAILGYTNIEDGETYYPINRERIARELGNVDKLLSVNNAYSFNKNTVKGAKQQLFIQNVYKVVQNHARQVSSYYGLAMPLRTFNRVFNKQVNTNVKGSLSGLSGDVEGLKIYFDKLLRDIQGISRDSNGFLDKSLRFLRGQYTTYQLGANVKTILSQATSYFMAGTYLSYNALVKGLAIRSNLEEMYKYSPYTRYRAEDKAVVKSQSNLSKISKLGETFTKPIQFVDRKTIERIWCACQAQIEMNTGDKVGTENNKKLAGQLLEKIVRETQPNSAMSERTGLARSDQELFRSMTMFTSVAQKNLSRIFDGVGYAEAARIRVKEGKLSADSQEAKMARKQLAKTLTGFTLETALFVMIGMFTKWFLGKRDEDKSLSEEFLGDFFSQIVGLFPIVKDIYEYSTHGYSMNNYALGMVTDMVDAVKSMMAITEKLFSKASGNQVSKQEILKPLRTTLYGAGQLLGVPVRNLYNYTFGLVNTFSPETAYKMNTLFYEPKTKDLQEAVDRNNISKAKAILNEIFKNKNLSLPQEYSDEIVRLYKAGYNIIPATLNQNFTYNDNEFSMTSEQYKRIIVVLNSVIEKNNSLISSKKYLALSDAARTSYLKANYNLVYIRELAKIVGVENLKEADYKKLLFIQAFKSNDQLLEYMAYVKSIEADVDKKGNVIANSKKLKIQKFINSLKISAAEKYLLMAYAGYRNANGKNIVSSYLTRQGLSKAEREQLLVACGY